MHTPGVTTYLLRDIPDDLWRQVKAKAALDGVSVKAMLLGFLRQTVKPKRVRASASDLRSE